MILVYHLNLKDMKQIRTHNEFMVRSQLLMINDRILTIKLKKVMERMDF